MKIKSHILFTKIIFLLSLSLFSTGALADRQWCHGKVERIYVWENGRVTILGSWRKAYTVICNLKNEHKGIEPDICEIWFSLLTAAQLSQENVIVFYEARSNLESCSLIPQYGAAPSPSYVMLQ